MTQSPTSPAADQLKTDLADLMHPLPWHRTGFSVAMGAIAFGLTGLALLPLLAILIEILRQGATHLSWEVFVSLPAPAGLEDEANGFANAILGTLIMVGVACIISIPLGVMTGIYVSELGQGGTATSRQSRQFAALVRFIATVLSGVPSIIVGVFAYAIVVRTLGGFSALAGGVSLAVIMLPIVALTTEAALQLVPNSHRLASSALGANRLQTTLKIVITAALPGITTGILLAIARAAGETAPLLFTALFSLNWPQGFLSPAPSLSVLIYNYANSPFEAQNQMAWTAALVLVGMVLLTSLLSRLVTHRRLIP